MRISKKLVLQIVAQVINQLDLLENHCDDFGKERIQIIRNLLANFL